MNTNNLKPEVLPSPLPPLSTTALLASKPKFSTSLLNAFPFVFIYFFTLVLNVSLWTFFPSSAIAQTNKINERIQNSYKKTLSPPASSETQKEQLESNRHVGLIGINLASGYKELTSLGIEPAAFGTYLKTVSAVFDASFAAHPGLEKPSVITLLVRVSAIPGKDPAVCAKDYKECTLMETGIDFKGEIEKPALESFKKSLSEVDEIKITNFKSKEGFVFAVYFTLTPEIYDNARSASQESGPGNPSDSQSCRNPNMNTKKFSV